MLDHSSYGQLTVFTVGSRLSRSAKDLPVNENEGIMLSQTADAFIKTTNGEMMVELGLSLNVLSFKLAKGFF